MITDPLLQHKSKSLRYSGALWSDQLEASQQPLARQAASLLALPQSADFISRLGAYVDGRTADPALFVWSFKPDDVLVQGPDSWGYHPVFKTPDFGNARLKDLSRPRPYLLSDDRVVETKTGDPSSIPETLVLGEQTVWFLPLPDGQIPVALYSVDETLFAGSGFIVSGRWLMLYRSPLTLWPDGVIPSMSAACPRTWKATALSVNAVRTSGRELALYRRSTQNLKQFERALCELAGLPLLDREGTVVRMETGGNQVCHWLEDGRVFRLPGASPFVVGSQVAAGDGHILSLRHQSLQGPDWWKNRFWSAAGIPVFVFRPGHYGFTFTDSRATAVSYDDQGVIRGRLLLDQDVDRETLFWATVANHERRQGVNTSADLFGFTAIDQSASVNALEVLATIYGPWLAVVETTLDEVDPQAFSELQDFVDRERPAGMVIHVRGRSSGFTAGPLFAVYLDTGELVMDDDLVITMSPGY